MNSIPNRCQVGLWSWSVWWLDPNVQGRRRRGGLAGQGQRSSRPTSLGLLSPLCICEHNLCLLRKWGQRLRVHDGRTMRWTLGASVAKWNLVILVAKLHSEFTFWHLSYSANLLFIQGYRHCLVPGPCTDPTKRLCVYRDLVKACYIKLLL